MRLAGSGCALFTVAVTMSGCGGATTAPPTPASSPAAAVAAWQGAVKLADAGHAIQPAFGGPRVPLVRMEGLPDGNAFALWERLDPDTAASARFAAGTWETPVEGSGPEVRPGDFTRWTWARRYLPGRGWSVESGFASRA